MRLRRTEPDTITVHYTPGRAPETVNGPAGPTSPAPVSTTRDRGRPSPGDRARVASLWEAETERRSHRLTR